MRNASPNNDTNNNRIPPPPPPPPHIHAIKSSTFTLKIQRTNSIGYAVRSLIFFPREFINFTPEIWKPQMTFLFDRFRQPGGDDAKEFDSALINFVFEF
ncbi:hypothetical protein DAPPUDRAFT_239431 [Daphnia pulex]|uniref:Uncharacterized protein n=1 Tax=Daphnia pulex TaxID=6669 RepID=E9G9B3_DAPPU|nr:hypothetical protein DAPPUDRAFT_239431 [Daphnia pulex]|eukprot:EFX84107.1 hypothetical protein DAPPUDRAFT_239431 [Daphnia pulex]